MKKIEKVLHEFKEGKLRSGSKKGPKVKTRKQAIAIAISEAHDAGERMEPPVKSSAARRLTIMRKHMGKKG